MFLAYPDYSLPWTLRTDASQYGVGAVLFQTRTLPDGTLVHEPLHFVSAKFSDEAQRWSTIEQECYAIYYAMRNLEYYLWGKPIVIETDHNNLQYMEMSIVPKIVRWRIYIQSFMTMIKHIPGKLNQTADYLSRMFAMAADDPSAAPADGMMDFNFLASSTHRTHPTTFPGLSKLFGMRRRFNTPRGTERENLMTTRFLYSNLVFFR